jgi:hypothetical protein
MQFGRFVKSLVVFVKSLIVLCLSVVVLGDQFGRFW